MQQRFAQNVILLVLVNLIIKPFWIFGIDRNVQNALGNEAYGSYFSMFGLTLIFQIIMDMGLHTYNNNTIAQQPATFRRVFPNIILTKLALTAIYLIIIGLTAWLFQHEASQIYLLLGVAMIQVANSFMLFLRGNVAALQLFKQDRILSVLDRLIVIFIIGSILLFPFLQEYLSIEVFIGAQILAMLCSSIIAYFICTSERNIDWKKINIGRMSATIKHGFPYAILVFCMSIYMRIDGFMIEQIKDSAMTGIFAKAFRLLDIANNMSGVLIASILLPLFARMISKKENLIPTIKIAESILIPFSVVVAVGTYFYAPIITTIIYGSDQNNITASLLSILILCFPLYCLNYIYSTLLTSGKAIKTMIYIALVGSIISIISNYIALQYFTFDNLDALAICIVLTQSIITASFYIAANRKFDLKYSTMLKQPNFLLFVMIQIATAKVCNIYLQNPFVSLGIFMTIAIISSLVLKLINPKNVKQLLKQKD